MKNISLTISAFLLCAALQAQTKTNKPETVSSNKEENKSTSKKADTKSASKKDDNKSASTKGNDKHFIDRYYMIKDSYKDMTDAYGPFAASEYDMDEFMKRYYSLKDGYPALAKFAANYAG